MVGVTVVVEELAGVVVGVPVVDTVVVVGSLQLSATKRKITCLLSYSKKAE